MGCSGQFKFVKKLPSFKLIKNNLIGLQSDSDSDGAGGIIGVVTPFNTNGDDPNLLETTAPIFEGESYWLRMDPAENDPEAFSFNFNA